MLKQKRCSCTVLVYFIGIFMVRSIAAAKTLHQQMLHSVIRSPMSFFDTTPIGRIVNRFSADTDTIDNDLPVTIQKWLECVFRVFSTIIVISYSTLKGNACNTPVRGNVFVY
jgi:ABC-type multidrug transport system fused ATPase/permease subunit